MVGLVLILGIGGAAVLAPPELPEVDPAPVPQIPLVEAILATPRPVQLRVYSFGTARPQTENRLVSEVAGRIERVSAAFEQGGAFEADAVLVEIDPRDVQLELQRTRAVLRMRIADSALAASNMRRLESLAERGAASAAKYKDAIFRSDHASAAVREAEVLVAQAERKLEKTRITSAYRGRVREKIADVGQVVAPGSVLGSVYATDIIEVRLPIRDSELGHLDLGADARPRVRLTGRYAGAEREWMGEIVRTESDIDPESRMLPVVALVHNPLPGSEGHELPVGLFVRAEILGRTIDDAIVLPRTAVRDGRWAWTIDESDRLVRSDLETLQLEPGTVVVLSGLEAGTRVCASALDRALEGTRVRVGTDPSRP